MTKPTFILFFGTGWCGTTSLFNTLQANLYMHGGGCKEPSYLIRNDPEYEGNPYPNSPRPSIGRKKEIKFYKENFLTKCDDPYIRTLVKVSDSWFKKIHTDYKNFTLEDTVNYYKALSDAATDYVAVGDFTNNNQRLSKDYLIEVKRRLEEHFTVKALSIHRDPVRRVFSIRNALYHSPIFKFVVTEGKLSINQYQSATEYFINTVDVDVPKEGFTHSTNNNIKFQEVFGSENVHNVIMEKFFAKDPEEVALLENFLDYKLPIITPCAFVPDRGINAPKLEGLEDQWSSDHEVLTPELYAFGREKLDEEYQRYEKIFGDRLPDTWGKPIDYGY